MARAASTVSQRCTSVASGWSRSSFPVFVLYSLKAASRISLKFEGWIDGWEKEDMGLMTEGALVILCSNSRRMVASNAWAGDICTANEESCAYKWHTATPPIQIIG